MRKIIGIKYKFPSGGDSYVHCVRVGNKFYTLSHAKQFCDKIIDKKRGQ